MIFNFIFLFLVIFSNTIINTLIKIICSRIWWKRDWHQRVNLGE